MEGAGVNGPDLMQRRGLYPAPEGAPTTMAIIDVKTEITGSVWKIVKTVGDKIKEDEPILILESMKMEIPVASPEDGVLTEILTNEGDTVTEGTVVARVEA